MSKNKNAEIVFKFTDFAGIDTCSISLTQLTVIAGPNSAGKTYVVYAIYSLLKNLGNFLSVPLPVAILQRLISTGSAELDLSETATHDYSKGVSANFMRNLPFYFSVNEDFFSKAKVEITIPPPEIKEKQWATRIAIRKDLVLDLTKPAGAMICSLTLSSDSPSDVPGRISNYPPTSVRARLIQNLTQLVFADVLPRTFPITSERTGISLFWKELDINKNQIIDKIVASRGKKIDPWELIEDETSRYALPITDNIDIARDAENVSKVKSFIASDPKKLKYIREIFDKISGGRYRYGQDGISFEYGTGKKKTVIPIYVASSSSKSLFLLDLYINNIAAPGDFLVFDEPELNLHLSSQRLMAQLLSRLVSLGVNVLLTTHSDFLIRELNDRVMLSAEFPGREALMRDAGIDEREVLAPEMVSGYLLRKSRKLEAVEVNEFGLSMSSIEEAIAGSSALQASIISLMTAGD